MNITTLITYFAVAGAILTAIFYFLKWHKNIFMTFLQNFCGVWFIFSGFVKAVDPIGTQYKMEQYFAEFETTFAGAGWENFAKLFPLMSKSALTFSMITIVLEIVLGVMLVLGVRRKLTAWLFFGLVLFFTILTGFTYMTGYVPQGTNFFDFAKWGPFVKTNMRVQDCGCFGDFILLEPKTSFFKDCFLMIPALLFVLFSASMHKINTRIFRFTATAVATLATILFCVRNTYWDLPIIDFRPFKVGTNLPERMKLEAEAEAAVKITAYIMENEKTGEKKRLDIPSTSDAAKFYMSDIYPNYKKEDGWKVSDHVKTEPAVKHTKVSDFKVQDVTANESEVTDLILENPEYNFVIVSYKLKHDKVNEKSIMVYDTLHLVDTIMMGRKTAFLKKDSVVQREVAIVTVDWDKDFLATYQNKINPFADAALKNGNKVFAITHDQPIVIREFAKTLDAKYTFCQADDILLKTMIRSNPGVMLMKNGTVVNMWHINKLPSFDEVKASMK